MGGEQLNVIWQLGEPVHRDVLEARQRLGAFHAEQVGPPGRTHEERAAGEDGHGFTVDHDQIRGVLGCVTRCVDRADLERSGFEILQMEGGGVPVGGSRRRRDHELRSGPARDLSAARDVVVVQVRFENEAHLNVAKRLDESVHVTLGIDDHTDAIVLHQIRGIAQTRRANVGCLHLVSLPPSGTRLDARGESRREKVRTFILSDDHPP